MTTTFEEDRRRNHRDNLLYIDRYVEWVLGTPNEVWSERQRKLIDSVFASARDFRARYGYVPARKDAALKAKG